MKLVCRSVLIVVGFFLAACDSDQLPIGTTVSITPNEQKIELIMDNPDQFLSCSDDDAKLFQDIPIIISVASASGSPIGGAEVIVYADYSGNTFSGQAVLQVYADKNGNGVVDTDLELVSGINTDAYRTRTDHYHGTTMLFVRMNLSCPYKGSLTVFVGGNVAQANFEVTIRGASETTSSRDGNSL